MLKCDSHEKPQVPDEMKAAMRLSADRALQFLAMTQEKTGVRFGHWGVKYIYSTSNVVCGPAQYKIAQSNTDTRMRYWIQKAVDWLISIQNHVGGWVKLWEPIEIPERHRGQSTSSQMAWALMALLTYLPPSNAVIIQGAHHLVETQVAAGAHGASWPERPYTGVGFPNHFYQGYCLYRHYFSIMALSGYASACKGMQNED